VTAVSAMSTKKRVEYMRLFSLLFQLRVLGSNSSRYVGSMYISAVSKVDVEGLEED
jgi:hypothetical protein